MDQLAGATVMVMDMDMDMDLTAEHYLAIKLILPLQQLMFTVSSQVQITGAGGVTITIPANTTMSAGSATTFAALAASNSVTTSDLPSSVTSVGAMSYGLPSDRKSD